MGPCLEFSFPAVQGCRRSANRDKSAPPRHRAPSIHHRTLISRPSTSAPAPPGRKSVSPNIPAATSPCRHPPFRARNNPSDQILSPTLLLLLSHRERIEV